jgi:zinc D-Ala-D-Ala carboxypeptidase
MQRIVMLRELLGFPFVVTSAYRCKDHPIEARKDSPGAHETGQALDIHVYGNNAHRLLDAALREGFSGVGVSQRGEYSKRFIHLDNLGNSNDRPRPTVWSY